MLNILSEQEYRSKKEYISFSDLKGFKSPYSFWNRKPIEQTKEMAFGAALHKYILEPEKFNDEYVVLDEKLDLRKTENKKLMEELTKTKKVVYSEDKCIFEAMLNNVKKHYSEIYLNITDVEVSLFDEKQKIKGRMDAITSDNIIVDLKTTSSLIIFEKDIMRYEYYIQAAMYCDLYYHNYGYMPFFYILALEKEAPYECCMYEISEEKLEQGREIYKNRLRLIRENKEMSFCEYYGDKQKIIMI